MFNLDDLYSDMLDIKEELEDDDLHRDINNILNVVKDIKSDILKFNKNSSELKEMSHE